MVSVMPRTDEWTVDDLDLLPDDGFQYELLDGLLLVTPAPIVVHQRIGARLFLRLAPACPDHLEVFFAPLDWRPDNRTSLQPDLLVVEKALLGVKNVTVPLDLAVEILSPSTRRKDRVLKFSKYEEAGVRSYWLVDPAEPSIHVFDLVDGRFVEAGSASGEETLTVKLPYPIEIRPSALI